MGLIGKASRFLEPTIVPESTIVDGMESPVSILEERKFADVASDENPEAEDTDSQSLECTSQKYRNRSCADAIENDLNADNNIDSESTQAEISRDQVRLKGKMIAAGERFLVQGVWSYNGDSMGTLNFASALDDCELIDVEGSMKELYIPLEGPSLSVVDALRTGQRRLFSGQFTMANPQYHVAKKKKRVPRKVLGVSEKFLLSVDENRNEGISNDFVPNSGARIICCGEGFNRFGRFAVSATLNPITGDFFAMKEYYPKLTEGDIESEQQRLHRKRSSSFSILRKSRPSCSRLLCDDYQGIRSSKRQRIPNKMLQLGDSGTTNYAFISRYGNGEGLSPYEYSLATGQPYSKSEACMRNVYEGGVSFQHQIDANGLVAMHELTNEREKNIIRNSLKIRSNHRSSIAMVMAPKIRKKVKFKTIALVRSLLQQQAELKAAWRSVERDTSVFSSSVEACAAEVATTTNQREVGKGQIYKGGMLGGMRHGYGLLMFEDGAMFEGQWVYGRIHGKGVFTDTAGCVVYQGGFVDGCPSGFGSYFFSKGSRYDGEFKDGYFYGYGHFCNDTVGCSYSGNWVRGKRQGSGLLVYTDGSSYNGEWYEDQWCGHGELTLKGILQYVGNFKGSMFEGRGLCKYFGCGSFEGNFRFGMKEGRGCYSFINGAVYEGRFSQDKLEGFGTLEVHNQCAVRVSDEEFIIPVKVQSTMKFVNRAAGF